MTHIPSFGIFPANHLPKPKLSTQPVHFGMLSSPQKAPQQGDVIDFRHNKQIAPNLKASKPVHFGADNPPPPTYDNSQAAAKLKEVAKLKKELIAARAKLSNRERGELCYKNAWHYDTVTKICKKNPTSYSRLSNTDRLQVICEVMSDEI